MKGSSILTGVRMAWPRRLTLRGRALRRLRLVALCLSLAFGFAAAELAAPFSPPPAKAAGNTPITGAGSTWAYPAIHAWVEDMNQFGITVNYTPNGSSSGRNFFSDGQADWGASEIPYGLPDGANTSLASNRPYVYVPDVAGGTVLMYNLQINGKRVTNLRLSGQTTADIFTNKVTNWNSPEIKADNPGLNLPDLPITPVVRSDGSGSTYDFTQWMLDTTGDWTPYCAAVGFTPCTPTSTYPLESGHHMIAQSGDPGVATYVSQAASDGAIGYTEYSWALKEGFPVAKLLNAAGFYTLPSPGHVAVSLLKDKVDTTDVNDPAKYLTQNLAGVYTDSDPRTYELSAYSYFILPTNLSNGMSAAKGLTIGKFGDYALCNGQAQVDVLGYSALPINLAEAGFGQLAKIPGAQIPANQSAQIAQCHNPTFSTNGTNTLADNDPQPLSCDRKGSTQCSPDQAEPTEKNVSSTVTSGNGTGSTTPASSTGAGGSAGGNGTGAAGGNGSGSSAGANGGAAGTAGPNGKGGPAGTAGTVTCDPNTGVCSTPGASGANGGAAGNSEVGASSGQQAGDIPVTLASSNDGGLDVTLMALAAGTMFLLSVVPPLLAQAGRRSRQRRGTEPFYDRDNQPGDRP